MKDVSHPARRLAMVLCAVALGASLGACHGFDPEGDTPFDPPPAYREWWAKTQACSGLAADFDRVHWSVVDGYSFPCKSGECVGHWESNHHIWIAKRWLDDEMVVRHEMLHDLIDYPGHPNPPFGSECPLTWETWAGGAAGLRAGPID
jgi:hypothetical protein